MSIKVLPIHSPRRESFDRHSAMTGMQIFDVNVFDCFLFTLVAHLFRPNNAKAAVNVAGMHGWMNGCLVVGGADWDGW